MHIVLFYQYYHNRDCPAAARHYTFVREWSKSHRVTIVTGRSWYDRRITDKFDWAPEGVDVRMIDVPYDNKMSAPQRMRSFAGFALRAVRSGLDIQNPDVIFATSTPLSVAWAASNVALLRRVRWIFEVRDLWPDFPIQLGAIPRPAIQKSLRRLESRLYRSARHIVTLSPDMEQHVVDTGIDPSRVTTVLNGTDFDLADDVSDDDLVEIRNQFGLAGKKVVLYAGAFGRANAIEIIVETAQALELRDDIRFVLIGQGFLESSAATAAQNSSNIIVPDPIPRHQILPWFRLADLSLVTFIDLPVLSANSPSKFFDSLGVGTPVIVTNPGWTKRFVEEHGCGWYVAPEDPDGLSRKIVEMLDSPWELSRAGLSGRRVALEQFDRVEMARQIEQILIG